VWYTVVGVVDNIKEDRFNFRIDRPVWYLPYSQFPNDIPVALMVQTGVDPATVMPAIRDTIASLNKNQPISDVIEMEKHIDDFMGPPRFTALLSMLFAGLGLILAAVGVYGVTAYSVVRRTREFSVRMAFGARWTNLLRIVMGKGFRLVMVGLIIGSAGGLAIGRLLSSFLYQVDAAAVETFVLPVVILLVSSLAATFVPMIRLARLDPVDGLRDE
jgi:ABC-type antimicrobial peptide transport system permease subunit